MCMYVWSTGKERLYSHIWSHSARLSETYDGVMKHKKHTVEAAGIAKDNGKNGRRALKDRRDWKSKKSFKKQKELVLSQAEMV